MGELGVLYSIKKIKLLYGTTARHAAKLMRPLPDTGLKGAMLDALAVLVVEPISGTLELLLPLLRARSLIMAFTRFAVASPFLSERVSPSVGVRPQAMYGLYLNPSDEVVLSEDEWKENEKERKKPNLS